MIKIKSKLQSSNILLEIKWNTIEINYNAYMLKAIHSYKIFAILVRKHWLIVKRIHIFEIIIMWTHFDLSTQKKSIWTTKFRSKDNVIMVPKFSIVLSIY